MFYRIPDMMSWITHFLVIAFIVFYFGTQLGLIDNFTITDYDYQEVRNFVGVCESEHRDLIKAKVELDEIKNTDIYRAYDECREDYRDLRNKIDLKWFLTIIIFIIILYWVWFFTQQHYKNKFESTSKKKRKK